LATLDDQSDLVDEYILSVHHSSHIVAQVAIDIEEAAMGIGEWLAVLTTVLFWYAAGGCWLLQVVAYPTYSLVGNDEFVPFHVDFGKRLMPVFVVPAVLACLGAFALIFLRPTSMPLWLALIVALCAAIILGTTMLIEVPKHAALDRDGKSETLIQGLVQNNLPRAISWTVGGILLALAAFGVV
jgi:hypothetical protein